MAVGDLILTNTSLTPEDLDKIAAEVEKDLAANAKEPNEFEEIQSIADLTSLPALQLQGGVYKLVRVAVSLLKGLDGTNGQDGKDGTNGREVELQVSATAIQWRYSGTTEWTDLIQLSELKGEKGDKGDTGEKGEIGDQIVLRKTSTAIQWKYDSEEDTAYRDLILIADIKGDKGDTGNTPILETVEVTNGETPSGTFTKTGDDESGNPKYKLSLVVQKGKDGQPPIFEQGTTTTVSPDTEASVEVVANGTSDEGNPKYILNFSIPKGRDGQDGQGSGNVYVEPTGLLSAKKYLFQPSQNDSANGTFVEYVEPNNFPEAPDDGKVYGRNGKTKSWEVITPEAEVAIQETTPSESNEEKLVFEVNEEEEGLYIDEDAPADGNYYARKDNSWQKVVAESVPEVSIGETDPKPSAEEKVFYKVEETEEESPIYITEAPKDDKIYGRKNGAWVEAGGAVSIEETVNITLTTDQSTHEALNGSEIHLKYSDVDKVLTWQGVTLTEKVPLAVQYTIEFPEVEGYKKPSNVSYLAVAGNVRSVDVVYKKNVINIIHIDQTISDPDSMVTGDVNGEVIQWIRKNSHRVLAKKTAEGEIAYYPLDDTNSNKYADGSEAKLDGTEGDVMLMLPTFYYKGTEGDQVDLMFSRVPFEDAIEWDKNILIGVYEAVNSSNKLYSKSGVQSTGNVSQADFKTYASARGKGYQLVDWQMHCVLGCLYYAMYGNTNCQATIGVGTSSIDKVNGQTDILGMTDTQASTNGNSQSINFWGLENWWGNKSEWLDDYENAANTLTATVNDPISGGTRQLDIPSGGFSGYPKKLKFGKYLDLIPMQDDPQDGTNSTGYCDQFTALKSSANYIRVLVRSQTNNNTEGGVSFASGNITITQTGSSWTSRLAFRGTTIQSESVSTFKSLPITN